jgi:hypothetical protein
MKKPAVRLSSRLRLRGAAAAVAAIAVLTACAGQSSGIPVQAELAGQSIRTTVDADIAKYYLEQYLQGLRSRPELDDVIGSLESDVGAGKSTRVALQNIARAHSTDLAALMLWQSLSTNSSNRVGFTLFREELRRLKDAPGRAATTAVAGEPPVMIAFAPGWLYQSEQGSGADFARPRQILIESGARTVVLDIEENGTIERNAQLITRQLGELSHANPAIIVVSASKAGPEVALALSELHRRQPDHNVKAWVNIGGILHGTALADRAVTWPWCWFVKLLVLHGHSFDGIESMTTWRSAPRKDRVAIPPDMVVVNYIGIPLSGQVTERARLGYALMREQGPNDGLTPIVDEIAPASITIAELGLDHFFIDPDIDTKTIALANTVIRLVQAPRALPNVTVEAGTPARPAP